MTEEKIDLLAGTAPNMVESIRAFHIPDLQAEAAKTGQHFLYAYCLEAETRLQVIAKIAASFGFPKTCRNLDALSDCLTDLIDQAGPQSGFVIVLEQLPDSPKFDKEARETLLDVFRDAADFWAEKKVAFRVFYSFE
ncbi:barstar family protein [Undibacterium jejuense]|uniref:Barstar family protein n=1 Tax=Undibacterium jejuense TaxID=1344949 RepID=A0A923KQM0_9BURK|nr:barstar family protein [Undibacterium jejuense]MBC3863006.1 barstar family protein [Undibacterium jejuense]